MNKKKITALLIAGVLTVGIVGGTFAWFTSSDSVTNKFSTGGVTDPETPGNPDAGIEIVEEFPGDKDGNGKYDNPVLPGTVMTKEVKVKSTSNYDQYLRAKVSKIWYYNGEVVTHYKASKGEDGKETVEYKHFEEAAAEGWVALNDEYIILEFATPGVAKSDSWAVKAADNFYYYNQLLGASPAETSNLLTKVTFSSEASNYYKNLTFDVKIDAEAVQATKAAIGDWDDIPSYVEELGK